MDNNYTDLNKFVERLKKIGIDIKLSSNYPWIYLDTVNGNPVLEKSQSKYSFTIGFSPIRRGEKFKFTNLKEIFKIIKKYR